MPKKGRKEGSDGAKASISHQAMIIWIVGALLANRSMDVYKDVPWVCVGVLLITFFVTNQVSGSEASKIVASLRPGIKKKLIAHDSPPLPGFSKDDQDG